MTKYILLLIPLIFISSCTIDWNDEKDEKMAELEKQVIVLQNIIETLSGQLSVGLIWDTKENISIEETLWNGPILLQTDDETTLSYSGKVVKVWSHTPPDKVPFIWDEACPVFFEKMYEFSNSNEVKSSGWQQIVWDKTTTSVKKECMKFYFAENIRTVALNERFYEIIQNYYESYDIWIYDASSWNLQEIPATWDITISETATGIILSADSSYGDGESVLTYTPDFSTLLSTELIPK